MDLKSKLSRLSMRTVVAEAPVAAPAASDAQAERIAALRARLQQMQTAPRAEVSPSRPRGPGRDLPAEARETPHGTVHMTVTRFAADHRHGQAPLATCLTAVPDDIAKLALDPRLVGLDPQRLLYFDLETTGLAGGAGTLPFLIGLAYFEDGAFVVEQLLLPAPGEEAPMLGYLCERVRAASALVTYNGKSFDWPLIRTRCVLNRIAAPEVERHVDLLHCARRVFKYRLQEMRLAHLEREVLGFERHDDIPGAEIPASYFAYLRGQSGQVLKPVLEHNVHDLVALAAVFGRLATQFQAVGDDDDPRERLGLAQVAARAGDQERAYGFATAVARGSTGLSSDALILAARIAEKQSDHAHAVELLHQALAEVQPQGEMCAALNLKLAKLYEHRLRDYVKALDHARGTEDAEGNAAHEARLARLLKRVSRPER